LLNRIHRRYATVTEPLQFGPVRIDFTRVADPNQVLDEIADEEDRREKQTGRRFETPLHLPYWAELWDSGGGVCQHLVDHWAGRLVDRRVLDLGCGQGVTGAVAARLGAKVLFADLEPPALLFARYNAGGRSVRTRRVDWQADHLGEMFDLIIGADILYDRKQWVYLEPFWAEHLAPGGSVLLGEPGRPTGGMFLDWLRDRPWSVTEYAQRVPTREGAIRVFELSRG
jgi:predicted nicotinamide N-methyase